MYRQLLTILISALIYGIACSGEDPSNNDNSPDVGLDDVDEAVDDLSLESIYPVRGSADGGELVSLYGTGFDEGATAFFGDDEAQVIYVSSTELETTTPGGGPGILSVTVENADGERSVIADAYEYVAADEPEPEPDPEYTVGWCTLQYPESTTTDVDEASEPIFGQVYVEGCTDEGDQCPGLQAELGWGEGDADQWHWQSADRNMDHDSDNNYEYSATITADEVGIFAYAYRFAIDGDDWTYCDLDGSDDGFHLSRVGELVVEDEPSHDDPIEFVDIGWCTLQWPPNTTATTGDATELIFGRVYVEDCTGIDQHCQEVTAQLGVGPVDGDPIGDGGAYTWIDADYNPGHNVDNNDEYQAAFQPTDAGDFSYLYRFSGDGGDNWTYCDLDGSDAGFDPDRMGELFVNDPT